MATELGKAYVQIVPSARGIKGSVSSLLNGEVTSAGNEAGNSFGGKFVSTFKKIAAAAAIGSFIKNTVLEGAKLEQSYIGGLETLYGSAAENMRSLAQEASTAGISANDYAEQAVSFGAALKQSFEGAEDAEIKAGEAANLAIMDMADNAAKMGTDLSSIQNAYQGFAKQNYTMLDNLKLGYGGTKTEMERLLKDAEKLTGIKYDINNLADVYSAIHAIQDDLGIAGVAAEEAKTTISGSFGAMSAAAKNFMGNLVIGEDIVPSLNALVTTASTFLFNNLLPAVANVLKALPGAIYSAIQSFYPDLMSNVTEIITNLCSYITTHFPELIEKGMELLEMLANGFIDAFPAIASAVVEMIAQIARTIIVNLPTILQKGIEITLNVAKGIIKTVPQLFSQVRSAFAGIDWLSIGSSIISGIANGLRNGISMVVNAARSVAESAWRAAKNFLGINSPSKMFSFLGEMSDRGLAEGISDNVGMVQNAMGEITDAMVQPMVPLTSDFGVGSKMNPSRSESINYGGIVINMQVPDGRTAQENIDEIEKRLAQRINSRRKVFA